MEHRLEMCNQSQARFKGGSTTEELACKALRGHQGQEGMQTRRGFHAKLMVYSSCINRSDAQSIHAVLPSHCRLTWKKRLGFKDSSLNWSD